MAAWRKFVLAGALLLLAFCFKTTIRGDGIGYYAYLPSLVGEGSLDLRPTFDRFLAAGVPSSPFNQVRLPNGLTADFKQVGVAAMALPTYALARVLDAITPGTNDPALGAPYQLAFTAASLAYAVLALVLLHGFVRELFGAWAARLAVAGVAFATPLTAYIFFEPSYNHTFTVAAVTVFALYLYKTGYQRSLRQWLVLGLLGGLMTSTHVQEFLFLALIPAEAVVVAWRRRFTPALLPGYALAVLGGVISMLPQLFIDRALYARWLPPSAPDITFNFLHPHLVELLVSTRNGWLPWTPLVVLACFGLPALIRRLGWFGVALVGICLGEFLINAALSDWWGGLGFGARRLTDQSLLLALSLGAVFGWLQVQKKARLAVFLTVAAIAWNVLLLANFYYIIGTKVGPPWSEFLAGQVRAVQYLPHLFVQGAVVRDALDGQILAALGTWLTLGLALITGWRLARDRPAR